MESVLPSELSKSEMDRRWPRSWAQRHLIHHQLSTCCNTSHRKDKFLFLLIEYMFCTSTTTYKVLHSIDGAFCEGTTPFRHQLFNAKGSQDCRLSQNNMIWLKWRIDVKHYDVLHIQYWKTSWKLMKEKVIRILLKSLKNLKALLGALMDMR